MCLHHAYSSSAELSAIGSKSYPATAPLPTDETPLAVLTGALETCVIEAVRPTYASSTSTYHARCEWNGKTYRASSRGSIVAAMARELIAAGHPDTPWQLTRDGEVALHGGSLYKVAKLSISEDDEHGLRVRKWRPREVEALAA